MEPAVGRARGRADLRTEYQDILDHGDEQLRAAEAEVDRLRVRRDDAAKTHGELVEAVQDLSTKEEALRAAQTAAAEALHGSEKRLMKAEIALESAEAILGQATADRERADFVIAAAKADECADAAVTLERELIEVGTSLGLAESALATSEHAVAEAEALLAAAEARAATLRGARRTLTLARFDIVRRTLATSLSSAAVFTAWANACEGAGDPSLVGTTTLRSYALELLEGVSEATDQAAFAAVEASKTLEVELAATSWAALDLDGVSIALGEVPTELTGRSSALSGVYQLVGGSGDLSLDSAEQAAWLPFATPGETVWSSATVARLLIDGASSPGTESVDKAVAKVVERALAVIEARRRLGDAERRDEADRKLMAMRTELQRRAPTSGSRATTFWEKAGRDLEKIGKDIEAALADFTRDVEKMMSDFVGSMQFLDKLVVLPAVVDRAGLATARRRRRAPTCRRPSRPSARRGRNWSSSMPTGRRAASPGSAGRSQRSMRSQTPNSTSVSSKIRARSETAEGSPMPRSLRSRRPTPTSSSSNVPGRRSPRRSRSTPPESPVCVSGRRCSAVRRSPSES